MAEWNPKTEQLIRDLGDYVDAQLRDIIDPKSSTLGTSSRLAFRHAAHGAKLMERARDELGCTRENWDADLAKVVALAKANGSTAGDKLEKALPMIKQISSEFGIGSNDMDMGRMEQMRRLKQVKKKGFKLD